MRPPATVSLATVRHWCLCNGLDRQGLRAIYREAHLICMARLLHYVFLEHLCDERITRVAGEGGLRLCLGLGPTLQMQLVGDAPQVYFELLANPRLDDAGQCRELAWSGPFLRALGQVLAGTPYGRHLPALAHDYRNSFCNLILNLALGRRAGQPGCAIEPVCRGHGYYPFPALRIGPCIQDVVDVSNLSPEPVPLFLVNAAGFRFHSSDYADPQSCAQHWGGPDIAGQEGLLPVHPWQLRLSPVVRELLRRDLVSLAPTQLQVVPLASQRTCRVLATGYDVKLALDATLTGERRLLYRLNSYNAPFVSSIVREVHGRSEIASIGFQYDVASLCWDDALVSEHLSAIVRGPCLAGDGEVVVPALNLWSPTGQAATLLKLDSHSDRLDSFQRYAEVLMSGPLQLCVQWGICLEPHMQNSYIVLRGGKPVRLLLRDLDNTIMDPALVRPICQELRVPLAPDTWTHMPDVLIGQGRLVHAMLHGHLYLVMHWLIKHRGMALAELEPCLEQHWQGLAARLRSTSGQGELQRLRAMVGSTKHSLSMRLEQSSNMKF
ncbi:MULTISPECIES: IucA/IucC family protein [unclassified Pseudomonas]|uniref:IucA/IucC family protein n=1 Tax=unclassified Pseudomonas TaxID=196821 RepID=UPI0008385D04|nr:MULTISPECIES: IucA/IucC family protein [unclassified Pseudomonas]QIH11527.1 IucA/IucC family siderophore biosynthesis protein [Pseudomonas sp. BIOMIG1BAC]